MDNVETIKRLRDELIRRQSVQQQAKASAEQSISEIKDLIGQLKTVTESNSEILAGYPNLSNVLDLDVDNLSENREQIVTIQERIEAIVSKMQEDVERILNV